MPIIQVYTVKPSRTPTTCERPSPISYHLYKHQTFFPNYTYVINSLPKCVCIQIFWKGPLWLDYCKRPLTFRILGSRLREVQLLFEKSAFLVYHDFDWMRNTARNMEISIAINIEKSYYNVNILQTFQMHSNGFPVPTAVTGNTSARMNLIIRAYLQALVNNNLLVSYHSYKLFYYYVRICEQKIPRDLQFKKKLTLYCSVIQQYLKYSLLL